LIHAETAFRDPVFDRYPDTVPAGESIRLLTCNDELNAVALFGERMNIRQVP